MRKRTSMDEGKKQIVWNRSPDIQRHRKKEVASICIGRRHCCILLAFLFIYSLCAFSICLALAGTQFATIWIFTASHHYMYSLSLVSFYLFFPLLLPPLIFSTLSVSLSRFTIFRICICISGAAVSIWAGVQECSIYNLSYISVIRWRKHIV